MGLEIKASICPFTSNLSAVIIILSFLHVFISLYRFPSFSFPISKNIFRGILVFLGNVGILNLLDLGVVVAKN